MPSLAALTLDALNASELGRLLSAAIDLSIDPADAAAIESGSLAPTQAVLLERRDGFQLWISPADEMPPAHSRIHFEVHLDVPGDDDRLVELGATRVREEPEGRWVVYADPEGNQFCAIPPR